MIFEKNEILFINSKWSKFSNNINYVKNHELNFKIIKYKFQIYFLKLNYLSYKKKVKKIYPIYLYALYLIYSIKYNVINNYSTIKSRYFHMNAMWNKIIMSHN